MSKACHTKSHMTVGVIDGKRTLIFNWSCVPHGIYRKAYRGREARNEALKEHMQKKLKKK